MTQREKILEIVKTFHADWVLHPSNYPFAVDTAITQIETLITEGKIEEVKRLEFTVTATDKAIGGDGGNIKLETLEAYTKLRIAELQASLNKNSNDEIEQLDEHGGVKSLSDVDKLKAIEVFLSWNIKSEADAIEVLANIWHVVVEGKFSVSASIIIN